jgi:hypothetical protein
MHDRDLRRRLAVGAWAAGQRLPTWADAAQGFAEVLTRAASQQLPGETRFG